MGALQNPPTSKEDRKEKYNKLDERGITGGNEEQNEEDSREQAAAARHGGEAGRRE